ncbi:MAG: hypothetical protein ACLPKB_10625 [Xanthobacteraceae bacterium]
MNDLKMSHCTGAFGIASVVLWLSQFPLYMMGNPPSVYDGAAFGQHLLSIKSIAFTRILLDQGVYVTMMVFAAGFRHLIRKARPDHEWVGTLVFGAALVWLAVTLVADGLEGGAVLDALSGKADSSAVRALIEGTLLIYNGSTAFVITGLFLASAGYATFATGVLPRWTGVVAYVGAALCVACVPAMYGGAVNYGGFYNAGGWGPALIANFPPAIWFLIVSIVMIRKREALPFARNSLP